MLGPVDVHLQASSAEAGGHLPVRASVLKAELVFELVDDIPQTEYGKRPPGKCCVRSKLGCAFSKGGPARNRAVFIISGRRGLGEGEVHREACLADLAVCFCAACARLPQGWITPCERLSVMKTTRFLAGWGGFCDTSSAFGSLSPFLGRRRSTLALELVQLPQGPGQSSKPKPQPQAPTPNPNPKPRPRPKGKRNQRRDTWHRTSSTCSTTAIPASTS